MFLEDIVDDLTDCQSGAFLRLLLLMNVLVVIFEVQIHLVRQEGIVLSDLHVVFDPLQEEPSSVSGIEASVVSLIMQVGNQPMPSQLGKKQNGLPSFFIEPSGDEEASESDEGVSAPAPHIACGKVREACTHANLLAPKVH